MIRKLLFLAVIAVVIINCGTPPEEAVKDKLTDSLDVFVTKDFFSLKYMQEISSEFSRTNKVKLNNVIFENFGQLRDSLDAIRKFNKKIANDSMNIASMKMPDLVIGLNQTFYREMIQDSIFTANRKFEIEKMHDYLNLKRFPGFIPLSWSYLAFMVDREYMSKYPETFGQLQDGNYKGRILLSQPFDTCIGNAFVYWVGGIFKKWGFSHYTRAIKDNIGEIEDNTEDAYNKFLASEYNFVLTYSSRIAYHFSKGENKRYDVIVPSEGHFRQVLGMAVPKETELNMNTDKLIKMMLDKKYQMLMQSRMYMFSVLKDVEAPSNFSLSNVPPQDVTKILWDKKIDEYYNYWKKRWNILIKM